MTCRPLTLTRAMPVTTEPGSIFTASGCSTLSPTVRSTSRMAKGARRCTRARPRSSNCRARFSLHGISGLLFLSRTNTAINVPLSINLNHWCP